MAIVSDDPCHASEYYLYDAYGYPKDGLSAIGNPYYFTSRRVDILNCGPFLQFNRNRYYDYELGRWITADPLGIVPNGFMGNETFGVTGQYSDGMNLYEYAGSNPPHNTDPWGLQSSDVSNNMGNMFSSRKGWCTLRTEIQSLNRPTLPSCSCLERKVSGCFQHAGRWVLEGHGGINWFYMMAPPGTPGLIDKYLSGYGNNVIPPNVYVHIYLFQGRFNHSTCKPRKMYRDKIKWEMVYISCSTDEDGMHSHLEGDPQADDRAVKIMQQDAQELFQNWARTTRLKSCIRNGRQDFLFRGE